MRITEVVCDMEQHTSGFGEVLYASQEVGNPCRNGCRNAHWAESGEAREHDVER